MDEERKQQYQALQQQAALMQGLAKTSHKCFMLCVKKPGKTLSSTEDSCLTNCVDRHSDMQVFLFERMQSLAQKETENAGMNLSGKV